MALQTSGVSLYFFASSIPRRACGNSGSSGVTAKGKLSNKYPRCQDRGTRHSVHGSDPGERQRIHLCRKRHCLCKLSSRQVCCPQCRPNDIYLLATGLADSATTEAAMQKIFLMLFSPTSFCFYFCAASSSWAICCRAVICFRVKPKSRPTRSLCPNDKGSRPVTLPKIIRASR